MNFITYAIMLNLFTMVTIQQYEEFNSKDENPIEKFEDLITYFKESWNKFSAYKDKGYRIKNANLVYFFNELQGELSNGYFRDIDNIKQYINDLNILV